VLNANKNLEMPKDRRLQLLNISLMLYAVFTIAYGLLLSFFPEIYVQASNVNHIPNGWIRWYGPILICLGIGAIWVIRKPIKQGIFITILALGSFLCGLTLLYSLLFEGTDIGNPWDTLSPVIVNFVFSLLFWIGLKQARNILW
jgi:uncharacterized protein YjeT (DUF2065 family)